MNRQEKRQEIRFAKTQKKILFSQLDKVYVTCKTIAKAWDLQTIPLKVLKETLKQSKPKSDTQEQLVNKIIQNFIGTYDIMYSDMEKMAKSMGVEKVPLVEIRGWIATWKLAYINAMPK